MNFVVLNFDVIKICPELLGGLSIPRNASEIINNLVVDKEGNNVTRYFELGAKKALNIALKNNIHVAILKKNSPSCGSSYIYDGTFTNNLVKGDGITAKLLKENGIDVLDEDNYLEYKW